MASGSALTVVMRRHLEAGGLNLRKLSEVAFCEAFEGEVFVEFGPMNAERGDFDMVQLLGRATIETWIIGNRETNF